MAFNLTTLPANITITSAVLRLNNINVADWESTNRSVSVHNVTRVWTEGTGSCFPGGTSGNVTWNNRTTGTPWSTAGGSFGSALATTTVGGVGAYTWTITSQAQAWYANPSSNNGVIIKYVTEGDYAWKNFASRNHATASLRPQLIVTYTFNCTTTIGGATAVCVGSTANVTASPSTGGSWSSLNTSIATVTAGGVVTGVSAGTVTLRFTQGSCIYNRNITVNARPTLGGATSVCQGLTANVTPSTGGTWSSSNTGFATVTNAGVVTGVSAGTVTLTFTSTAGCVSTRSFTVNPTPSLGGATSVCVGTTANVTPSTGGTWTSGNTAVATVTNAGVVSGVSAGTVTLTFTSSTGCTNTRSFTVNAGTTLGGATSACVGSTANVTPSTGGVWTSSNSSIASITNAGVVGGIVSGTVTLTFTNSTTGCVSTRSFTVNPLPSVGGATQVAAGGTANVTPSTGGTWVSTNPGIATVNNDGLVTGVSAGVVTLEYTEFGVTQSTNFTVNAQPTLGGATEVCAGSVANVTPSSGGIWTSSNTAVAVVNNSGQVVGISSGTVTLTYTTLDGCASSTSFQVKPAPAISGPASVKVGSTAIQSPQSGGTWTSSNTDVATITNLGVATGVAPGAVLITFTSSANGCSTSKVLNVVPDGFYKNTGVITPGNEEDPDPDDNIDTEEVDPQSWTALVISVTNDVNGNGQGDEPIDGVQIIVRDLDDNILFQGPTGPDGLIAIENLPPVQVIVTQIVPGGSFTLYDNPVSVAINLGETSYVDFVNSSNGSISGFVFLGFDDEVMEGVLITLLDEDGNPVLDGQGDPITTLTDDAGFYQFLNVPLGSYQVQQTVHSGFTAVEDVDGGNLTINGDVIPIVLLQSSNVSFMDFVNSEPASIVGTVLIDTSIDGGGDTPHVGVTLNLLNSAGLPVLDSFSNPITTVSDFEGNFVFNNIPSGSYRVSQDVPSGFTAISDSDGGNFTVVGDVELIVLDFGDIGIANFTNQPQTDMQVTKAISNPTPAFGSQVTFTITATNNGPNAVTAAKVEEFGTGLTYVSHSTANGTFTVEPGAPADTLLGTWNVGALAVGQSATLTIVATVSGDTSITAYNNNVIISSELGDPDLTNNEFDVPLNPPSGSIRGRVRIDTTGDKVFNIAQPGVTVTLLDESGNPVLDGNGIPITSVTDANGLFVLENLPPGTYQVAQAVPTGFIAVADTDGGNLAIIGDVTPIVIGAGTDVANRNFVNSELGSIAGNVSRDLTGDTNGNTPIANISVFLLDDLGQPVLDPNDDVITTLTDMLGNYLFSDVVAGQYQVAITVPSGLIAVNDVDGGDRSINGDVTLITVIPAQDRTDQNFVLSDFADLGIVKSVSDMTPNVGDEITFTLVANNYGPSNATGVQVTEVLSSGYSFVSADSSLGTYDPVTGLWTIGNLANAAEATLTITVKVLPDGDYTNAVVIAGDQPDPNPPNDEDEATPDPKQLADLGIVKSVSNMTPNVGDEIDFTLVATNFGPSDATGVQVTEILSSGYTFVSANATVGTYNAVTGLWTIGDLANAANATLTITVEVLPTGDYTNAVVIVGNEEDPNPPNDEDEETPDPNPLADLGIVKSISNSTPNVGDNGRANFFL